MSGRRLPLIALIGLLAVLVAVVWLQIRPSSPAGSSAAPTRQGGGAVSGRASAAPAFEAPSVALAVLSSARVEPGPPVRDPFSMRQRAAPPPARIDPLRPLPGLAKPGGTPGNPSGPAGVPPPPPIPLRLIGLVVVGEGGTRVAVLSDGSGVYYGKDGDVIDGRYRIVRVGAETVEMTYVDGRGRQTFRLPGGS